LIGEASILLLHYWCWPWTRVFIVIFSVLVIMVAAELEAMTFEWRGKYSTTLLLPLAFGQSFYCHFLSPIPAVAAAFEPWT
jgi:hypothetical protein